MIFVTTNETFRPVGLHQLNGEEFTKGATLNKKVLTCVIDVVVGRNSEY